MRISDWSSDVCSSDLDGARDRERRADLAARRARERYGRCGAGAAGRGDRAASGEWRGGDAGVAFRAGRARSGGAGYGGVGMTTLPIRHGERSEAIQSGLRTSGLPRRLRLLAMTVKGMTG